VWVWMAWKGRDSMDRAIGIIRLACKILFDHPILIAVSLGLLGAVVAFTWLWVGMFTRVFLRGTATVSAGGTMKWIVESNSWVLGAYFILMYLWTWGVISGIQRATTSATVSQWYFHRHVLPPAPSRAVVTAAILHSTTTLLGTICLSALAALLVRLPLLLLPRRLVSIVHLFCFSLISAPITAITTPLTLTYAAIHSQPLLVSSRAVTNLRFLNAATNPRGRHIHSPAEHPLRAYRLAKMLLSAARALTALTLGFGGWVYTTRRDDAYASLYGYLVGLIAGSVGWVVVGGIEGGVGMVVDAAFVCFAVDQGGSSNGAAGDMRGGHCREAEIQFGGF